MQINVNLFILFFLCILFLFLVIDYLSYSCSCYLIFFFCRCIYFASSKFINFFLVFLYIIIIYINTEQIINTLTQFWFKNEQFFFVFSLFFSLFTMEDLLKFALYLYYVFVCTLLTFRFSFIILFTTFYTELYENINQWMIKNIYIYTNNLF